MTRLQRNANLIAVVLPFVGVFAACLLLWNEAVNATDLALFAGFYVVTAFGITLGYHRLFTHRAFTARRPLELALAVFGSAAVQGPLADWVADHRKHHAHTDEEGDPHSPHVGHGSGLRGLLYAHMGWLLDTQGQAERRKYARDIMEDRTLKRISILFPYWAILFLVLPTLLGFLAHGGIEGALRGLVWGGLVRVFFTHHITWSINSICHFYGRRRFDLDDHSTNVAWLAIPSLGESWHHNHHAFPRSAHHGLRPWEIDVTGIVVIGLEKLGLVSNVVRITPERQREKLAGRATQAA